MRSFNIASSIVLTLSLTHAARAAEEAYFRVPVVELKLVEGQLPAAPAANDVQWDSRRGPIGGPRVLVNGAGREVEAYLVPNEQNRGTWSWGNPIDQWTVTIRAPQGRDVNGRVTFARPGEQASQTARFTIPSSSASADHRDAFLRARAFYYDSLTQQNVPGAAWFRYLSNTSRAALSQPESANEALLRANNRRRGDDLADTYALFSGGRAVSENLQLDRALPPTTQPNREGTPTSSIRGVTVKEIDWAPLIKDAKPQLDPLASLIPADQHAIFFPSAAEAMAVLELAERHGTPALQSIEPQAESAQLRQRYERQLCRSAKDILSLAKRSLIRELAVTGSDPYLRVGTDIALLIQTSDPDTLRNELLDAIRRSGLEPANANINGLTVTGGANADRSVSAYLAVIDGVAVLTNSREQLRRLAAVRNESAPSLAAAPEYVFFRDRYRRGEGDESALFILSDATIRRWCGPRWRIGDSRRTRAAAVLADRQAAAVATRAGLSLPATQPMTDRFVPDIGELRATDGAVTSSTYNTLAFMTPITELDLEKVTTAEADAYGRWRDGYQRNWSWAFDPISLRVSARPGRIAGDVTVMPLIDASRYRSMIETSRGASIAAGSGDPHEEALAHLAYAVNVKSASVRSWATSISDFAPQLKVNALDWLGPTVAIYADGDAFWTDLAAAKEKGDFFQQNLGRLPIGIHAQVQQPLKLAALLTAMRAFVDQSAPGLTQWQTVDHNGQPYVRITANVGAAIGSNIPPIALCYVATPDSFTLTLSEDLLRRAIDRQRVRGGATTQTAATAPTTQPRSKPSTQPWLGQNLAAHVDGRFVDLLAGASDADAQRFLRSLAWGNIPILNEWRRVFPDRDPLEVHEELWHVRLLEPAGGTYRWNAQWQTMESSVYGHPAEPKAGPAVPPMIDAFKRGSFGIDFEEQGIRARAEVTLNPAPAPATQPK